jgi:hypothetical protein
MEEADIELWYEEQKQILSEQYIKSIAKGMSVEHREKHFNRAMEKLNAQYEKRHTKYARMLDRKKTRSELFKTLGTPFNAVGRGFLFVARFLGSGTSRAFKDHYAQAHFNMQLVNIRHAYKMTDGLHSMSRPFYHFYVKHLKMPLIIITNPFVKLGRYVKKKITAAKDSVSKAAATVWKYTKISAKFIAKHATSVSKKVSARMAEWSKKHNEWQAKRIQTHLDKKAAKEKRKADAAQAETKLETV